MMSNKEASSCSSLSYLWHQLSRFLFNQLPCRLRQLLGAGWAYLKRRFFRSPSKLVSVPFTELEECVVTTSPFKVGSPKEPEIDLLRSCDGFVSPINEPVFCQDSIVLCEDSEIELDSWNEFLALSQDSCQDQRQSSASCEPEEKEEGCQNLNQTPVYICSPVCFHAPKKVTFKATKYCVCNEENRPWRKKLRARCPLHRRKQKHRCRRTLFVSQAQKIIEEYPQKAKAPPRTLRL